MPCMAEPEKSSEANDLVDDEKGLELSPKDKTKMILIGVAVLVIVILTVIGIGF